MKYLIVGIMGLASGVASQTILLQDYLECATTTSHTTKTLPKNWYVNDYSQSIPELLKVSEQVFSQAKNKAVNIKHSVDFYRLMLVVSKLPTESLVRLLQTTENSPASDNQALYTIRYRTIHALGAEAPEQALALLPELTDKEQNVLAHNIVFSHAHRDASVAWQWLQSDSGKPVRKVVSPGELVNLKTHIIGSMGKQGDVRAIALAYQHTQATAYPVWVGKVESEFSKAVVTKSNKLDSALQYAINDYQKNQRKTLLDKLLVSWAEQNPQSAANYLLKNIKLIDVRNAKAIHSALIKNGGKELAHNLYKKIDSPDIKRQLEMNENVSPTKDLM